MAQSAQAKEVILEIGEEIGVTNLTNQVQNGTVTKTVFDTCNDTELCDDFELNSNSTLTPNWAGWYQMTCEGIEQGGNAPQLYPGGGINPTFNLANGGESINYIFDYNYSGNINEGNIIVFDLLTNNDDNPGFNGITYSNNGPLPLGTAVNNSRADAREYTEQGRMLYLTPTSSSEFTTRISFEILEGLNNQLGVRGPGERSIGDFLTDVVDEIDESSYTMEEINDNSTNFWDNYHFTISPFVHTGKWHYNANGSVEYNEDAETVHASYVPGENYASMVTEDKVFGTRSFEPLFDCQGEFETDGYKMRLGITNMTNCVVEVLTYVDFNLAFVDNFAFEYAGVQQTGTDWVWETIDSTGIHDVCVPYYYNTIDTEEVYNADASGWPGGWSTSVRVQTGGGGLVSGQVAPKHFYNHQHKFFRIKKLDPSQPCRLIVTYCAVKNAGYSLRDIEVPTYETQVIRVPSYDYKVVDIYDRDKIPLALTFNSGDLRDPSKRSTGYSKTFELPASIRNQQFLKTMTADGSNRQDSDISWRKARVSANGIVVFSGFARIEKSMTGQGGRYSCHILQDPSYWPELIGDKKLCELTFPEHTKDFATIQDSWTKTVDDIPYVYPAINYGKWSKDVVGDDKHSIADFHPATYAKAIVDKIFEDVGYTIDSNFFNSPLFKKLIIPYTSGETYKPDVLIGEDSDYSSQAALSQQQSFDIDNASLFGSAVTDAYYPVLPCVNGCTNYQQGSSNSVQNGYTVPFTGRYTVMYSCRLSIGYPSAACWNCVNSLGEVAVWLHIDGLCPIDGNFGQSSLVNLTNSYYQPWYSSANTTTFRNAVGTVSDNYDTCDSGGDFLTAEFEVEIDLIQGEQIQVAHYYKNPKVCDMAVRVKRQNFGVWPVVNQTFEPPAPVSISQALGCKVKQIDFLKGLTEMFNLYWTADNDLKTVTVEPYDDFYAAGRVVDWTHKIDRTNWTDKFVIDDLAKTVLYKYKEDNSDDIVKYVEENNPDLDHLWSLEITPNDIYRKEDKNLGTTVFHPTFRILDENHNGDQTFVDSGQPPIMPCMWSGDDDLTDLWFNNTERPDNSTNFGLRILNWYGLSNETGPWKICDDGGQTVTLNEYPYAYTYNYNHAGQGQLENNLAWHPIASGLNPMIVQIGAYQRGLFDRYYGRLYEKVTGGAALRTAMMDLTQKDISQFDFRDIIKIDMDGGVPTYWTVYKICDYAPGKSQLTKVELVEWKYGFHKGKPSKVKGTNYGIGNIKIPVGGFGQIQGLGGDVIVVEPNGNTYNPTNFIEPDTLVPTKSNLTFGGMTPVPSPGPYINPNKERPIHINDYNGITNNPISYHPIDKNRVETNGVAFGFGLQATKNQIVVGNLNRKDANDTFQVGAGYYNKRTGQYERVNAISVSRGGEVCFYGGEVCADMQVGDVSITADVYYETPNGEKKKVYLKRKNENY